MKRSVPCSGVTKKGAPCKNTVSPDRRSYYRARWCGRCQKRGDMSTLEADANDAALDDVLATARSFAADGWLPRDGTDIPDNFGLLAVVRAAQREGVTDTEELLDLFGDELLLLGSPVAAETPEHAADKRSALAAELVDAWQTVFPFNNPQHQVAHLALLAMVHKFHEPVDVIDNAAAEFHHNSTHGSRNRSTGAFSEAEFLSDTYGSDIRVCLLREIARRDPEMHPTFRIAMLLALSSDACRPSENPDTMGIEEHEQAWLRQLEGLTMTGWERECANDIDRYAEHLDEQHGMDRMGACGNIVVAGLQTLPSGAAQNRLMEFADNYASIYSRTTGKEMFDCFIPVGWRVSAQDNWEVHVSDSPPRHIMHHPEGDTRCWPVNRVFKRDGHDDYSEALDNFGSSVSVRRWVSLKNPPTAMLELAAYMPSLAAVVTQHPKSSDEVKRAARATLTLHDGTQSALVLPDPGGGTNSSDDGQRTCNRLVLDHNGDNDDPYRDKEALWRPCRNKVQQTFNNGWCGRCRGWERTYGHAFGDDAVNRLVPGETDVYYVHPPDDLLAGIHDGFGKLIQGASSDAADEPARHFAEVLMAEDLRTHINADGMHRLASNENARDALLAEHESHIAKMKQPAFQHAADHAREAKKLLTLGTSAAHCYVTRDVLPIPSLTACGIGGDNVSTHSQAYWHHASAAKYVRVFYDGKVLTTYLTEDNIYEPPAALMSFTDYTFVDPTVAALLDGRGVDVKAADLQGSDVGGLLVDGEQVQLLPDDLFNGSNDQQERAAFRTQNWCTGDDYEPRALRAQKSSLLEGHSNLADGVRNSMLKHGVTPTNVFPSNVVDHDTGHVNVDVQATEHGSVAAVSTQALNAHLAAVELAQQQHDETHGVVKRLPAAYVALRTNSNGNVSLRTFRQPSLVEHKLDSSGYHPFGLVRADEELELPVSATPATGSSNPSDSSVTYFPVSALRAAVDAAIERSSPVVSLAWGSKDTYLGGGTIRDVVTDSTGTYVDTDDAEGLRGGWVYVDADVSAPKSRCGVMFPAHVEPGLSQIKRRSKSFVERADVPYNQQARALINASDNPIGWTGWEAAKTLMQDNRKSVWRERLGEPHRDSALKAELWEMLLEIDGHQDGANDADAGSR